MKQIEPNVYYLDKPDILAPKNEKILEYFGAKTKTALQVDP
jgi:hypothetical protein